MTADLPVNLRELAAERRFDEAAFAYVQQTDYVPFHHLKRAFSPYIEVDGDRVIEVEGCRNLFYWMGLSDALASILCRLARHGLIRYEDTSPLTYLAEGQVVKLPVAPRPRSYKRPHWLPAVLRALPISHTFEVRPKRRARPVEDGLLAPRTRPGRGPRTSQGG